MTTAFSSIVAAVIAALEAEPAVCGTIYRARERVVPEQADKAINVQFENALPSRGAMRGAPVDWSTRVTVECFARSVLESGGLAVDPLFQAVYERLAADSTLGGVASDVEIQGIEAENTNEGKKTGWVRLTYIVQHRTSNLNLSLT